MSRGFIERKAATPYLATWDQAEVDLTSEDATQAPLRLPELFGQRYVNLCIAGVANTPITFTWQLCLFNRTLNSVIRSIPITTVSTARRSALAGAAGFYMHNDVILDLGGFNPVGENDWEWALALSSIGGDSAAYLMACQTDNRV